MSMVRGSFASFLQQSFRRAQMLSKINQRSINIQVSPSPCLLDQCPTILVTCADKDSMYTIKGSIKNDRHFLVSYAHFKSSSTGEIDPSQHPSLGGTYTGVEKGGLFWSLQFINDAKTTHLAVKDVHQPLQMFFSVHQGTLTAQELQRSNAMAEYQLERRFLSHDVQSYDILNGRLRGIVFKPHGKGPFPGVIDMIGLSGGLKASRAALLASYGFATYVLPFFAYKDLPKTVADVEFEYFQEALNWYSSQKFLDPSRIGLIGTSLGATICLIMATLMPDKVRAVVAYSPTHHRTMTPLKYQGEHLPYLSTIDHTMITNEDGEVNMLEYCTRKLKNADELTAVQIEQAKAEFLFIAGEDDQLTPSVYCTSMLTKRLSQHGHHNHSTLVYPGTGHIIDPGLFPVTMGTTRNPFRAGTKLVFGGSLPDHAKAQEYSWDRVKEFLKEKLA